MSKKVLINESELHNLIFEAVNDYLLNESEDEGLLKNLYKGYQAGKNAKIDYQKERLGGVGDALHNSLSQRFAAGKEAYNLQKQYTRMGQLRQELQQLVDDGAINPKQTVQELLASFGGFGQVKDKNQRRAEKLGTHLDEND